MGSRVRITTVLTRRNQDELHKLIHWCVDVKNMEHRLLPVISKSGRGNSGSARSLALMPDEIKTYLDERYLPLYRDYARRGKAHMLMVDLPRALLAEEITTFSTCAWGIGMVGVGHDGRVGLCHYVTTEAPYSVETGDAPVDLEAIWFDDPLFKAIRSINSSTLEGVCGNCIHARQCRGLCRLSAYQEFGSIYAPYPVCQQYYEEGLFPTSSLRDPPAALPLCASQARRQCFLSQLHLLDSCSFSGEDIRSGQIIEYQADKIFPIASCAKLLVLASVARLVHSGELNQDLAVRIRKHERVAGSGRLKLEAGTSSTVEKLCLAMICLSDNTAYNKLFEIAGKENIGAFLQQTGMASTAIHRLRRDTLAANVSCASDFRVFWKTAGDAALKQFRFFFRMLRANRSSLFMGALLPHARVFHKTGVLDHSANLCIADTGYVRSLNRAYSITFLTSRQRSLEEVGLKIAVLSRLFIDSMTSNEAAA